MAAPCAPTGGSAAPPGHTKEDYEALIPPKGQSKAPLSPSVREGLRQLDLCVLAEHVKDTSDVERQVYKSAMPLKVCMPLTI